MAKKQPKTDKDKFLDRVGGDDGQGLEVMTEEEFKKQQDKSSKNKDKKNDKD